MRRAHVAGVLAGAMQGRFVDMQIRWQNHTLRPGFCDNGGCDRRRVITAKTSHNGVDCKHHDRCSEGLSERRCKLLV